MLQYIYKGKGNGGREREREREIWKNERINKENGKHEHSPFILDIPMISLPLPPTALS
jgi:hypothetical protein